jgi:hypothetical protein
MARASIGEMRIVISPIYISESNQMHENSIKLHHT